MDQESVQIIGDLYVNLVRARGEILRLKAEVEEQRRLVSMWMDKAEELDAKAEA